MSHARDLSTALGEVRDQGPRGTCLAFAATAVHEQARRHRRGDWPTPLGEESLYWACKQIDGDHQPGTYPQSAAEALRDHGQSAGALWPYDPARDEAAADYIPPDGAQDPSEMRKASLHAISHGLDTIRTRLDAGHAVVLGLELWPGFFTAPDGDLGSPTPLELIGDAHAVAVVGYDDASQELLLRNSWGETWGRGGHGRLPYRALATVARGAWTVDDDIDP